MPESEPTSPTPPAPPRCVLVAGTRGAGKTRWIQQRIRDLKQERPTLRIAVLQAEDGRTRMERFVREVPGLAVRRLTLPCPCCPALANLPGSLRQLVADTAAEWVFIELPVTAALALLGEFDREVRWPREFVVCQGPHWPKASTSPDLLPPFFLGLLESADCVVPPSS